MDPLQEVKDSIKKELEENPVLLYMKGTKESPQCGFSSQVVQILNTLNVAYTTRDVLEDGKLRRAIKEYSNWPTLPQLYIKGELVGGCDVVTEMYQNGELQALLRG